MLGKLAMVAVWLVILPTLVGCLFTDRTKESRGNAAAAYLYGLFAELALFEVLAVPMTFLDCSLTLLTRIWAGGVLVLALLSVMKNRSYAAQRKWLCETVRGLTPLMVVVLVLLVLQMLYITGRQHLDEDDSFYLATSTTAVETDSLFRYNPYTGFAYRTFPSRYVLSAWPLFVAVISRLSGFHPAILAHMALPAFVLFWAYLVYALFGARLFPGDKNKQSLFLLFVTALICFSGYSRYSAVTFLMIRSWQGKAVLAGFGLPALAYGAWMSVKEDGGAVTWLLLFAMVTGACLFTSMGVVLSLTMLGCCALAGAVLKKNWTYLWKMAVSCLPALVCGVVYLVIR